MANNGNSVNAAEAQRSYCQAAASDPDNFEKVETLSMLWKDGCAFEEMIREKRDVGSESCLSINQIAILAGMHDICFQHALKNKKVRCRCCCQDVETERWIFHVQRCVQWDECGFSTWGRSSFAGKVNKFDFYMRLDNRDVSALVERHYNQPSPTGRWVEKSELRKKCLEPLKEAFLKACVPENGTLREYMSDFTQMVEAEHEKRQKRPTLKLGNAKMERGDVS